MSMQLLGWGIFYNLVQNLANTWTLGGVWETQCKPNCQVATCLCFTIISLCPVYQRMVMGNHYFPLFFTFNWTAVLYIEVFSPKTPSAYTIFILLFFIVTYLPMICCLAASSGLETEMWRTLTNFLILLASGCLNTRYFDKVFSSPVRFLTSCANSVLKNSARISVISANCKDAQFSLWKHNTLEHRMTGWLFKKIQSTTCNIQSLNVHGEKNRSYCTICAKLLLAYERTLSEVARNYLACSHSRKIVL